MNPIKHVAIIMDGNGRWGTNKGKSRNFGHKEGLKSVEKIIKETIKKEIKFLTLYLKKLILLKIIQKIFDITRQF